MPMVSIVMPVYNGEKYLRESIDSIVSQTFADWELILVNDCSSDRSLEIMKEYDDARIRIINNETNQKLPRSLNIGFRYASGRYFTWTSDDNRFGEKALEHMVLFLEKNPRYAMVYSSMYFIDSDGQIEGAFSEGAEKLYYKDVVGGCFLYRREAAEKTGGYDEEMFLVEDYDYWLRINAQYEIYHLDSLDYYYRRHKGSLTQTKADLINRQLYRLRLRELPFLLSKIAPEEKECLVIDMIFQDESRYVELKRIFWHDKLPENIQWIERKRKYDTEKKIILFGAGIFGQNALTYFGEDKIYCFVDNNSDIVGTRLYGKQIISFEELQDIYQEYQIVIAVDSGKVTVLAKQLDECGITDYICFIELINRITE